MEEVAPVSPKAPRLLRLLFSNSSLNHSSSLASRNGNKYLQFQSNQYRSKQYLVPPIPAAQRQRGIGSGYAVINPLL